MSELSEHTQWQADRRASVTSATGNLALTETRWTGDLPDLEAERRSARETVTVTPLQRTNIETGAPEHGLRVWDADAPAIRAFDRIDTYEYDPAWVLEGHFTPVSGERRVSFEHIRDNGGTRDLVVPGDIRVELDGREYDLAAFDDGGTLLLVFGDETNGSETYGSGRFLFVQLRDDEGTVVLDFNRAFVPPCGFSAQYNCPLPPASNRFPLPIRAGEKNVVFRDGFDIYAA
ncbi:MULTISPECIES: DUF1684 domain-containing protein [Microbacterium]|uniref:DUF1684 domain-containing protein n=1 Tax=Microbacterium TaxID=33882 RepID=UPI0006FF38A0|nr:MULTISPECIES: DUF1684 domain-containing protein [Microbacterium]KAA0962067.1 DUF1684 domain-containing protein [Microbacterium sp. ANT_H45B]KQZ23838.1 hypothetical protein ASD43_05315 [Microbacterium sp. Root553]MCP1428307.1 uncharacterized protein (DUF1684 family) [Microbacterium foliorum]